MFSRSRRNRTESKRKRTRCRLQFEPLERRQLLASDFGDAPDFTIPSVVPHGYPTRLADDGARHEATGPTLGTTRDTEADGQPGALATTDDGNGSDAGQGGVSFPRVLAIGQQATFTVNLQNADPVSNKLDAWIDFNRDGDWSDSGEHILSSFDLGTTSGNKTPSVAIPLTAEVGDTFARFRLSTAGNLSPTGAAADGEVEDYKLSLQPTAQLAKWDFDQSGTQTSSPITDASGNGRNLTLNGFSSTDLREPATLHATDLNSLRFPLQGNATNTSLNLSPSESIDTIAFWLRPENFAIRATTDPHVVMEFGGDSGVKVVLGSWTSGVANEAISLVMGNASTPAQITSVTNITREANQWVHVAFVWSPSDARYDIYLNGLKQVVRTLDAPAHVQRFTADTIRIGSRNANPNLDLRSQLDDIQLYYGSLTEADIASLAVNLIARWNFDNDQPGSAFAQDTSGNARDLTLSGIGAADWRDGATPMTTDTASLRLPLQGFGANSNLNIPGLETIDTIAFWINPENFAIDANADPRVVIEFGGDNGVKVVLGSWTSGVQNETISLVLGNAATPAQITSVANTARFANRWTHVAFVWSPLDLRYDIYLDGAKQTVTSLDNGSHVQRFTANSIRLGSRTATPNLDVRSQLDDVRLYHGSLPESEIRALSVNLIAHWNFDDNANSAFTVDSSGNQNTLTLIAHAGFSTPATTDPGDVRSMRFAKNTRGINSPNPFVLPPGQTIDTIAFWLRPEDFALNSSTDPHVVMELGGDSGIKVVLGSWTSAVANETISLVLGSSPTPVQITSFTGVSLNVNTWAHIALVWSYADSRYDLYFNAVKVAGYSLDTPSHVGRFAADSILIGDRNATPELYLRSFLDDIRLYHGALSLGEITRLSQNPNN